MRRALLFPANGRNGPVKRKRPSMWVLKGVFGYSNVESGLPTSNEVGWSEVRWPPRQVSKFDDTKFEMHVSNQLPQGSVLKLHCASKDDDLGYHTLAVGQEFRWKFCENVFSATLFFCTLRWGSEFASFDAFYTAWAHKYCISGSCFWIAEDDGIYFQDSDAHPFKVLDWKH
ncbi:S-protein homolog 7-like [Olea europaea var. sylvestris]|uniref:S-protein homolog 7-like n=1 Tax=Olea europaea var. sylvestris TaxID=158386 RepID=UPI000C1D7CE9|nr:S-protein homolog 7-like [Olea europaea var. sylvestris]